MLGKVYSWFPCMFLFLLVGDQSLEKHTQIIIKDWFGVESFKGSDEGKTQLEDLYSAGINQN